MNAIRKPYKGKLTRPIKPIPDRVLHAAAIIEHACELKGIDPATRAEVQARDDEILRYDSEFGERTRLLFEHFECKQGDWPALAQRLAMRHVPGFRIAKDRAGAKTKWTPTECASANMAIAIVRREHPRYTAEKAARFIVDSGAFGDLLKSKDKAASAKTLLRRAQESDAGTIDLTKSATSEKAGKVDPDQLTLADIAKALGLVGREGGRHARKLGGG